MVNFLIWLQRWLYGGMADSMRSAVDITALPPLMAGAFLFGMVHALMPGHGKSVLVSYHLGRPSRVLEGVATGTLLAVTHVGSAVLFVMAGVAVISRSLADGGRAPGFETMSAALIASIGLYLVVRAIWPSHHTHERDGRALAFVTGLIPCPLTTFILTYALTHNKLIYGLAAVIAMLGGVILTLVSFAVGAVTARSQLAAVLQRTEKLRELFGFWLELASAAAVLVLGLWMLKGSR